MVSVDFDARFYLHIECTLTGSCCTDFKYLHATWQTEKHKVHSKFVKQLVWNKKYKHSSKFFAWKLFPFSILGLLVWKDWRPKKLIRFISLNSIDWKFNEAKMRRINRNHIPINFQSLADHMSFVTILFLFLL